VFVVENKLDKMSLVGGEQRRHKPVLDVDIPKFDPKDFPLDPLCKKIGFYDHPTYNLGEHTNLLLFSCQSVHSPKFVSHIAQKRSAGAVQLSLILVSM